MSVLEFPFYCSRCGFCHYGGQCRRRARAKRQKP